MKAFYTLILVLVAGTAYGQNPDSLRQVIEQIEKNIDINSIELPNKAIEFTYTFGPSWDNMLYNPKAVLLKKNNQLDLQVIGAAPKDNCYKNFIPTLDFNKNSSDLITFIIICFIFNTGRA
jgi:hypothetical protein